MGRPRKEPELDLTRYAHRLSVSIKEKKEKSGISTAELAQVLGVSSKTVYGWESGRYVPSVDLLPKIAEALGVSVRVLMPKE